MNHLIGSLLLIIGILVVIVITMAAIKAFFFGRKTPQGFPYEKEEKLFSPAERSFFSALQEASGELLRVMGKVRLADIIRVKKGLSRNASQAAFNRIQSKHCDFICL